MQIFITIIKYITLLVSVLSSVFPISRPENQPYEAKPRNLGIPLKAHYDRGIPGRSAWDVEVYENKLFVASGDYDQNIGPVHIYYYDLNLDTWVESGSVSDEQIEHFHLIDGKLMAPGADPKQDWNWGNIYIFDNDTWITKRSIAGGIHQLDMIQHDGRIFVALGVLPGQIPIAVSDDGCETFREVPMYKDGEPFTTSLPDDPAITNAVNRCYDFFLCNDTLYAFHYRQIDSDYQLMLFRYEDGAFHYHSDLPQKLNYRRISYEIFRAKVQYENKAYISTGKLYVSSDMLNAEEIILEEDAIVSDLRVIDGLLYVMTVKQTESGEYTTSVWVKKLFADNEFRKLYYFTYPCAAQSFTYHGDCFYFGMGDGRLSQSNSSNGSVLSVKHPLDKG